MSRNRAEASLAIGMALPMLILAGCNPQSAGFALPPGDAGDGRATFVELQCNQCHSVADDIDKLDDGHPEINFALGGRTTRVRTYGELVTSIIDPSHKISRAPQSSATTDAAGQSNMYVYNEVMTVRQLIDLTSYLQASYDVYKPQYTPHYYGP